MIRGVKLYRNIIPLLWSDNLGYLWLLFCIKTYIKTYIDIELAKEDSCYCIRPNCRPVRLGFSKLLGKLVVYVSIYTKKTLKTSQQITWMMLTRCFFVCFVLFFDCLYKNICCGFPFELLRQVDAIQIGTHNISLYKEVDKKYND